MRLDAVADLPAFMVNIIQATPFSSVALTTLAAARDDVSAQPRQRKEAAIMSHVIQLPCVRQVGAHVSRLSSSIGPPRSTDAIMYASKRLPQPNVVLTADEASDVERRAAQQLHDHYLCMGLERFVRQLLTKLEATRKQYAEVCINDAKPFAKVNSTFPNMCITALRVLRNCYLAGTRPAMTS